MAALDGIGRDHVFKGVFHEIYADEKQAEPGNRFAHRAEMALVAQHPHKHADADQGQGEGLDIEFKPHKRDQPAGHRGADIGAVDHAQRLAQRQHARVDEADHRHRDGR